MSDIDEPGEEKWEVQLLKEEPEEKQHSEEQEQEVVTVEADIVDVNKKWYGVPPKGEQPLPLKYDYVLLIWIVIVIEILIWAVYRYTTAPYFESFGTMMFYTVHIIAAPTIHLIPIIIFWRYFRKEKGMPFVFTKKLLMSGVIVGFIGAIIWRLWQQFSYDTIAGAAGGTVPGTLTFLNLLDPPLLFSLMTFVHFFVVGPVEELEFRSFAQDQASRVLPNWQALFFSSVLFGCSHIPIALFVYQFPPHIFVAALFGWISAGFVFGALYIWSRNIFACIVMHGMGNWQLSVYYFTSTGAQIDPINYAMVDIATTIVADASMIILFFLIHKYYWQPHRRGEPAFGGIFQSLQNFVHEHDFERKPVVTTMAFLVAFCMIIGGTIMGIAYAFGATELSGGETEAEGTDVSHLESLEEFSETEIGSSSLNEGDSEAITFNSKPDKYIKGVNVKLTWMDEPDGGGILIPYENQPDTFSITINGPNATEDGSASNSHGAEGSLTVELAFTLEDISKITSEDEEYEVSITVTMEDAGDQESPTGLRGEVDNGNSYDYEIEIVWVGKE